MLQCRTESMDIGKRMSYVKNKVAILTSKKERYDATTASKRAVNAAAKHAADDAGRVDGIPRSLLMLPTSPCYYILLSHCSAYHTLTAAH